MPVSRLDASRYLCAEVETWAAWLRAQGLLDTAVEHAPGATAFERWAWCWFSWARTANGVASPDDAIAVGEPVPTRAPVPSMTAARAAAVLRQFALDIATDARLPGVFDPIVVDIDDEIAPDALDDEIVAAAPTVARMRDRRADVRRAAEDRTVVEHPMRAWRFALLARAVASGEAWRRAEKRGT